MEITKDEFDSFYLKLNNIEIIPGSAFDNLNEKDSELLKKAYMWSCEHYNGATSVMSVENKPNR